MVLVTSLKSFPRGTRDAIDDVFSRVDYPLLRLITGVKRGAEGDAVADTASKDEEDQA